MRGVRVVVLALAVAPLVAACGSSAPPAGEPLAAQACQSSGSAAAGFAQRAAAANGKYAGLSVDEQALATQQATQSAELSDGSGSGSGSLEQDEAIGTSAGQKVLADCVSLGLPVRH